MFTTRVYLIDSSELGEQVNSSLFLKMYKYALRIDKEVEKVKTFLGAKGISGWGVREVADQNEHWHFYLETDIKPSSFRVVLKRAVPELAGNGAYSVSDVKDVDKYIRYMAKGEQEGLLPEVVWKHGLLWGDEKVEELHEEYWTTNKSLKKRRAVGVMDWVVDECKRRDVKWDDRRTIGEIYLKELAERSKPINLFAVKSNINLVQVKLCPDDTAINQLAEQLVVA